jgi:hypothetical protein
MVTLHQELRAGKYRLDKNSEVLGGRAAASAEALYAAVALGDQDVANTLFGSVADPALLFDHVFNVFRVWCLGLYVAGSHAELEGLLAQHDGSTGLRRGYVEAFRGLLRHDAYQLNTGIKTITRFEWEIWQDPRYTQGLGVVSLTAAALARLARDRGLVVSSPGPMMPEELLGGTSRQEVAH